MSRRPRPVRTQDAARRESVAAHVWLLLAVAFALYPVLWVLSTAFSAGSTPERRVLPLPSHLTLEHVRHSRRSPHVV